jgi:hypothetical protein
MRHTIIILSALVLAIAADVHVASAQVRWGRGAVPRSGACFYQDSGFRGDYFCAGAGDSLPVLPGGMGDQISSIRLFGGANVTVFRDGSFDGRMSRFDRDVTNLKRVGWNDTISSIRVGGRGVFGRGERPRYGGRPPVWGRGPMPRQGACFYEDAYFRGQYFCVERGDSIPSMPPGFNDRISSIRVVRGNVTIYRDSDFRGRSSRIRRDVPNLGSSWGDRVSSVRVN